MVCIAALSNLKSTPSSRFRLRALIPALAYRGVNVTDFQRRYSTQQAGEYFPGTRIRNDPRKFIVAAGLHSCDLVGSLHRVLQARRFDGIWISREVVIGHPSWEYFVKGPLYYDIDDAVFLRRLSRRIGVDWLIRDAECVFAGNNYLADYCSNLNKNVLVVPTAVDIDRFYPISTWRSSSQFRVTWSGTSSSFAYLKLIEAPLVSFFRSAPDATLNIYSDRYPMELGALREHIRFELWSAEAEVAQIQESDVGLMPLPETDWARGKCSYKMLLYAACGVPCIVTDFGMNSEVLAEGRVGVGCRAAHEWYEALMSAYRERDKLREKYPDGPRVVRQRFSVEAIADQIALTMGGFATRQSEVAVSLRDSTS